MGARSVHTHTVRNVNVSAWPSQIPVLHPSYLLRTRTRTRYQVRTLLHAPAFRNSRSHEPLLLALSITVSFQPPEARGRCVEHFGVLSLRAASHDSAMCQAMLRSICRIHAAMRALPSLGMETVKRSLWRRMLCRVLRMRDWDSRIDYHFGWAQYNVDAGSDYQSV